MNEPDKFELFQLQPNEKKITLQKDTKIQNAANFVILKEDHTLGNTLRMQLLRDKDVLFAGYRVPHPLQHCIHVKIQTTTNSTPAKALDTAIGELITECATLEEKFRNELLRKRNPDQEGMYM